jgi:hypothetical protein
MTQKRDNDQKIIKEAQKKFGTLSQPLMNAVFLRDAAAALRTLMREQEEQGNAKVVEALLRFSRKHQLAGMSPSNRA